MYINKLVVKHLFLVCREVNSSLNFSRAIVLVFSLYRQYVSVVNEWVREQVQIKFHIHRAIMKDIFYKRTKEKNFMIGDLVLKWDARREAKGKHGKFDNL
jgi:hypothetical protein